MSTATPASSSSAASAAASASSAAAAAAISIHYDWIHRDQLLGMLPADLVERIKHCTSSGAFLEVYVGHRHEAFQWLPRRDMPAPYRIKPDDLTPSGQRMILLLPLFASLSPVITVVYLDNFCRGVVSQDQLMSAGLVVIPTNHIRTKK